ncbi:hypothetical protein AB1Y20_014954 [Prymnesium parvum]|uniref:Uncharacterized protein n=1 Tax=Prymnesium parvum TaxID=97485 RepID=A0AB34JZZ1_PRYPA
MSEADSLLKRKLIAMLAEDSSDAEADSEDSEDEVADAPPPTLDDPAFGVGSSEGAGVLCAVERALQIASEELDALRRDCRVAFALGSSNWLDADATPRCTLERIALSLFTAHTRGLAYERSCSGAEWWAQVRESGHPDEAIELHWDVDEYCCDTQNVNVHPRVSNVLYLTDEGAPTLVLQKRAPRSNADLAKETYGTIDEGCISWPSVGKLLAFDGRLLHGTLPLAPAAREGLARVTLLVNIWLGHRPRAIEPLPASLAASMSQRGAACAAPPFILPRTVWCATNWLTLATPRSGTDEAAMDSFIRRVQETQTPLPSRVVDADSSQEGLPCLWSYATALSKK